MELLDDVRVRKIIINTVASIIILLAFTLGIIPAIQNSEFTKIKNIDSKEVIYRNKHYSGGKPISSSDPHLVSADSKIYSLGRFVTSSDYNSRHLHTEILIVYTSDSIEGLERYAPIARNLVIDVLDVYKNRLHHSNIQNQIERDIIKSINRKFGDGMITGVLFGEFLTTR